jgi:hypothetical protein
MGICLLDGRLRALNNNVVTLDPEIEVQKRERDGSWMAKIQQVEELDRSIRVTDTLLLSIHAAGRTWPTASARSRLPASDLIVSCQT